MKIDLTRVMTIDFLIRQKATGSPAHLAQRLDISKRTLFFTLCFMKDSLQAPISYNRYRETYFYSEEGLFCFTFQKDKKAELKKLVLEALNGTMLFLLFNHIEIIINNNPLI